MKAAVFGRLQAAADRYEDLPPCPVPHREHPYGSSCLSVKEKYGGQTACGIIGDGAAKLCASVSPKLSKLLRFPGMAALASFGFLNGFCPKKKGSYRMDVTDCPYFRFLRSLDARS